MDGFVYQCRKMKNKGAEWSTIPWTSSVNNFQKLWQVERFQQGAQKTYTDIQTVLETLMNGPNEWLLHQAASLYKCKSSRFQWTHHTFLRISNDLQLTALLCVVFHKHFNFITFLVYYLSAPWSQNFQCNYHLFLWSVKNINRHLNHKHKFTKITVMRSFLTDHTDTLLLLTSTMYVCTWEFFVVFSEKTASKMSVPCTLLI